MANVMGIYRQFSFKELEVYGSVNKLFMKILMDVYAENGSKIPLDMLAHIMDIMSYDRFIRAYAKENKADDLEYGVAEKLMDLEIMDCKKFSENMLEQMITFNIVPYQITEFEMIFITPEIDIRSFKDQEFVLFRRSIANVLGASDKTERIKRSSNKLFSDCLAILQKKQQLTEDDIKLTSEQKLNKIFIDGIIHQASDVFIDTKRDGIDVSFSIFNDKVNYRRYRMSNTKRKDLVDAIFKLAGQSPAKIEWTSGIKDFNIKNLGDLGTPENYRYEGRVNVVNTVNDPSAVVRIHDTRRTSKTLDSLPLNSKPVNVIRDIINNRSGIIVIGGAKGQGKSTTIYACLDTITKEMPYSRVEEMSHPVEVQLDSISQLSLDENLKVDFSVLKRASTRRNAKVNFIGEINDDLTTDFVVNVAGQECLVLTTIHAESISMIPMKVQGFTMEKPGLYFQFIELLKGMVHQVMLKKACPSCSKHVRFEEMGTRDKDILMTYGWDTSLPVLREVHKPDCNQCGGLGFLIDKPVVCLDVLMVNDEVRDLIRDNIKNPRLAIEQKGKMYGNTGVHDALRYLARNEVTYDMIYRCYQLQNVRESEIIAYRK